MTKKEKIMNLVHQLDRTCYDYGKYKAKKDIEEHITQIRVTIKPLVEYEKKIGEIKREIELLLKQKKGKL